MFGSNYFNWQTIYNLLPDTETVDNSYFILVYNRNNKNAILTEYRTKYEMEKAVYLAKKYSVCVLNYGIY